MFYCRLIAFQLFIISLNTENVCAQTNMEVSQKFQEYNFTQDGIIPSNPQKILKVAYGDVEVNLGNTISDLQVALPPSVSWDCRRTRKYTLVMCDPDVILVAYNRTKCFLHWMIINIRSCDISTGQTVSTYFPPVTAPPPVKHRYSFFMWEQKRRLSSSLLGTVVETTVGRANYSVFDTSNELGSPKYGNFFIGVILKT